LLGDLIVYLESAQYGSNVTQFRRHPVRSTSCLQRSSLSRPADAGRGGLTVMAPPVSPQARWLGANRGAREPSLISRVTAKRRNEVAGKNRRELSGNPSL